MQNRNYYIINAITMYRLVAAPALVFLIFTHNITWFSILLPISFLTDLIDGFLARKFGVTSIFGSRLDSIGDDLTVLAGVIGGFVFKYDFFHEQMIIVVILIILLLTQNIGSLIKYKKLSSFHTYLAKVAAVFQGLFLILLFIIPTPLYWLFYITITISIFDLIEEIILLFILKTWKIDVKGLYWVLLKK